MNHQEALRRSAVEKYLLNEMPQPERDEFEEHFFGCQECAADLRATAAFLDGAKKELPTLAPPQACAERAQETLVRFSLAAGLCGARVLLVVARRGLSECRGPAAVRRRAGAA